MNTSPLASQDSAVQWILQTFVDDYNKLPNKNTPTKWIKRWLKKDKWNLVPVHHLYQIDCRIYHPESFDEKYKRKNTQTISVVSYGETVDIDKLVRAYDNLKLKLSDLKSHHASPSVINEITSHIDRLSALISDIVTDNINYYNRRTH